MTKFALIGQKAIASEDFLLDDLPGSSGRLDVLLRCLRSALLTSHGLRRDVVVYLVLLGGPLAPRVMRVDGSRVQFLRPDERSLAVLAKKVLVHRRSPTSSSDAATFEEVKPGIALAHGSLDVVLRDSKDATVFLLDEHAPDIRNANALGVATRAPNNTDRLFVLGDHMGVPADALATLDAIGAHRISIGPVSVHADDVVAIVQNELDRLNPPSL